MFALRRCAPAAAHFAAKRAPLSFSIPLSMNRSVSSSSSSDAPGSSVKVSPRGSGVWVVSLDNPQAMNALTVSVGEEFEAAIQSLKTKCEVGQQTRARKQHTERWRENNDEETANGAPDDEVRCVIITGDESNRAFSAGGDLDFLSARTRDAPASNAAEMRRFYARCLSLRNLPVPTIAALNGHAVGAGLCLALACDLRLAASKAKLGVNFATLGIHPGMGCSHFLPQYVTLSLVQPLGLTNA
jgi:enoyl-CoA hydratase